MDKIGLRQVLPDVFADNPPVGSEIWRRDGNDAPKFSAAIMVLGLGEIIFPHFPPPIMAINNLLLGKLSLLPAMRAIGAIVITATSMNTPMPVSNMAAKARAK